MKYRVYNEKKEFQNISDLTDQERDFIITHHGYFCEKIEE